MSPIGTFKIISPLLGNPLYRTIFLRVHKLNAKFEERVALNQTQDLQQTGTSVPLIISL